MSIVWLDGELVDKADAKIGVADHGLLFGDMISVDMRAYGGRVFRLRQHLESLQAAAVFQELTLPLSGDELAAAITATLHANDRGDGFVKVVVTRGAGPQTLDPRKCVPVTIIFAEEAAPFPRELYECGLDVTSTVRPYLPSPEVLSTYGRLSLKLDALGQGCLEAIAYSQHSQVLSGSETDVGIVSAGLVKFAGDGGVTHAAVADAAVTLGLATNPRCGLLKSDLDDADEVFLTSAAAEIIAVRSIDGKLIGLTEVRIWQCILVYFSIDGNGQQL